MKPSLKIAAALGALACITAPAVASAQARPPAHAPAYGVNNNWVSINQRQAVLDQRINLGLRSGALSAREATSLRVQYRQIAALESRYRQGGLTAWERADLDRRFNSLSASIRIDRVDRDRHRG